MAGDWIKVRIGLWDDPNVIGIATTLSLSVDEVVGKLVRLWGWADQHLSNGYAKNVTRFWIDVRVGCDGFADAMATEGWLEDAEGGITLPNFDRHMGKSGKIRSQAQRRMKTLRKKRNTPVTQKASPEKRREEKSIDASPSGDACPEPGKSRSGPVQVPQELVGLSLYEADEKLCRKWPELLPTWRSAYPGVDVLDHVRKAHAWELSNEKQRKVDKARFLNNWLSKEQDRAIRGPRGRQQERDLLMEVPPMMGGANGNGEL